MFAKLPTGTGGTQILSVPGLELTATCIGGKATLIAKGLVNDSSARFTFGTTLAGPDKEAHTGGSSNFDSGDTIDLMAAEPRGTGELIDHLTAGGTVTVLYGVDDATTLGGFEGCVFSGVAFAG